MKVQIKTGSIGEAVAISKNIPEFIAPPEISEYERRLAVVPHLILIARVEDRPVGFKVGYEREPDGSFTVGWVGLCRVSESTELRNSWPMHRKNGHGKEITGKYAFKLGIAILPCRSLPLKTASGSSI